MSDDTEVVVQKMVSECRRILERKARHEVLVTYEDLAREVGPKVGIRGLSAHDPRLSRALGDLSTSTYDRHKILLSVLVVKKEDRMPGGGPKTGFYGPDLLVMCATYGWSYDDRKTRPRLPTTETQTA